MKIIFPTLGLFLTSSAAFAPSQPRARRASTRQWSSSNAEVDALLAAAAKAREEANRLSEKLGRTTPAATLTTTDSSATSTTASSLEDIQSMLPALLTEADLAQQTAQWQEWGSSLAAFGSANLRTYPVSLSLLEQRTGCNADTLGLTESDVSLDAFKYATLYVTGGATLAAWASLAFLPENVGATFCYFFALVPILFLGIGSTAPGLIAEVLVKTKDAPADTVERQCRHEAAHFCCGYWSGLPIAGYSVVGNGVPRVEFDVATAQGYSPTEVAALTVTAVAGVAAEALHFGAARGAAQDLQVLEQAVFRRSRDFVGAAAAQDLTRWGVLAATLLLRQNAVAYEAVVEAFARQASVEECVALLEKHHVKQ